MDIQEVLQALNVKSVYWVDDEHTKFEDLDVDHLLDSFKGLAEAAHEDLLNVLRRHMDQGIDKKVYRKWINNGRWMGEASFDDYVESCEDPKAFLIDLINVFEGGIPKNELNERIGSLMSQADTFEKYSFQMWSENNKTILESLQEDENLLLLLDLNNAKEQCLGLRDGYEIIQQLADHEKSTSVYILVLTSTYDTSQELIQGRRLTNDYCSNRSIPIFVISKRRDLSGEFPKQFAEVLGRVLLATNYTDLKVAIERIYKDSIAETFRELKSITIEELVYKVAKLSSKEGVPEIDSVLRIIDGTARFNLQEALANDSDVVSLLSNCRSLDAKIERLQDIDDSFIKNFTRRERYENYLSVNNMHLPIQVGDVFSIKEYIAESDVSEEGKEQESKGCYYILLGNFCFTSLRESGERRDKTALLFPVLPANPGHNVAMELNDFSFINPDSCEDGKYFIDFSCPRSQDYFDLDQCWTNPQGKAEFKFEEKAVDELMASAPLIRSQRKRMERMVQEFHAQVLDPGQQRPKIERIGRLTENHALRALHSYTRLLSNLPEALALA